MAELKTKPTDGSVEAFLDAVPVAQRQADARELCDLLTEITGEQPVMWGPAIVGFGSHHLVYESGRELDWMVIGFSPRKANLTIYLNGPLDMFDEQLARLGKHTRGKGCLYLKKLSDADPDVLAELLAESFGRGNPTQ